MTELEKVRKGLYMCEGGPENCGLKDCPYFDKREFCEHEMHRDALTMLKEREPKPVELDGEMPTVKYGKCPHCGEGLNSEIYPHWCGFCGQAVKWE